MIELQKKLMELTTAETSKNLPPVVKTFETFLISRLFKMILVQC